MKTVFIYRVNVAHIVVIIIEECTFILYSVNAPSQIIHSGRINGLCRLDLVGARIIATNRCCLSSFLINKLMNVMRNMKPVNMRYSRVPCNSFPNTTGNPVKYHARIAVNSLTSV